jgi:hypothetical protein
MHQQTTRSTMSMYSRTDAQETHTNLKLNAIHFDSLELQRRKVDEVVDDRYIELFSWRG